MSAASGVMSGPVISRANLAGTALVPVAPPGGQWPDRLIRGRLMGAAWLSAPVIVLSAVPALRFPHWQWVALALACAVAGWGAWPVHPAGGTGQRSTGQRSGIRGVTDVLVAAAVLAALGWSFAALLLGVSPVYPEVAAGMTVFWLAARLAAAQAGAGRPGRPGVLVAVAGIVVAVAALGFWIGIGFWIGTDAQQPAFATAVAVLVAACPCALAVAAPPALARAARVDTVVLTESDAVDMAALRVHAVHATRGSGAADALRLAGAIGRAAENPVGRAIAASATVATGPLPGVAEFDDVPGLGWRGVVAEVVRRTTDQCPEQTVVAHAVLAGRPELLTEHGIGMPADLVAARASAEATGRAAVAVAWDGVARAVLVIGAAARPSAADAVREIRALGLTPMLLARDGSATALAAAGQVGIRQDELVADVPAIERLRGEGRVVAVVGEDVGTAHGDPLAAVGALRRARRAASVIRWNTALAITAAAAALPFAAAGAMGPTLAAAVVVTVSAVVLAVGLHMQRSPSTGA